MVWTKPIRFALITILAIGLYAEPLDGLAQREIGTPEPPMDSPFDSDGDGVMTADELKMAITTRQEEFELPDGYELSLNAKFKIIDSLGQNTMHQNGGEYAWLGAAHMCAWGDNWLRAHQSGDTEVMDESMDQLLRVTLANPMYEGIVDHYREISENAEAGDPGPLEQLLKQQCRWDIFTIVPTDGKAVATPQVTPEG